MYIFKYMKSNVIFAVLNLMNASRLLKYATPGVSDAILLLSKKLVEAYQLKQQDLDEMQQLADSIAPEDVDEDEHPDEQ